MARLEGKVALVTGGASGLGEAIAQRLARDGARVVITDTQAALGRKTAAMHDLRFIEQDVCSEERWPKVVGEIQATWQRLDILVNNAGILGPAELRRGTPEHTVQFGTPGKCTNGHMGQARRGVRPDARSHP